MMSTELEEKLTGGEVIAIMLGLSMGLTLYVTPCIVWGANFSFLVVISGFLTGATLRAASPYPSRQGVLLAAVLTFVAILVVSLEGIAARLDETSLAVVIMFAVLAALGALAGAAGFGLLGSEWSSSDASETADTDRQPSD